MESANKTWSGRFSEPVSELVKRYTASVTFDKRMAEVDIQGSLAHAAMLNKVGVLSDEDRAAIERGMSEILQDIRAGRFDWSIDLEDVHMNIEARLTDRIGATGEAQRLLGRARSELEFLQPGLLLDSLEDRLAGLQRSCREIGEALALEYFHAAPWVAWTDAGHAVSVIEEGEI